MPSNPPFNDGTELAEYLRVVADCANLEVALARERESRKQAEAALRKISEIIGTQYGTQPKLSHDEAIRVARAYFDAPIPQEPAEQDRPTTCNVGDIFTTKDAVYECLELNTRTRRT